MRNVIIQFCMNVKRKKIGKHSFTMIIFSTSIRGNRHIVYDNVMFKLNKTFKHLYLNSMNSLLFHMLDISKFLVEGITNCFHKNCSYSIHIYSHTI